MPRLDETHIAFSNPADQLEKGLEHCRKNDWKTGMEHMRAAAERLKAVGELPSRYYSYLGYGLALKEKKYKQGVKLCRYAIKQEFYQPENYVNLAKTFLLAKNRRGAAKAILKGLEVDAEHADLLELQRKIGARRQPVFPFLSRSNFLNQLLGRMRHSSPKAEKKPAQAAK